MAQYPNLYNVELTKGPAVVQLEQMFLGDVLANRIGAIVTENGEAVTLGGTCSGTAILANGGTVSLSGTVSGNTCYIDMPSSVYAVEGPVEIFVANVSGGKTITLVAAFGCVRKTQTGSVIDPGTIIPSVSALIDAIDAAVASIPADYTALLAAVAPTFSASKNYTAGRYVWNSGNLYRFTADHAAGSWTGTDAVQVVVTDEIANLKSAVSETINLVPPKLRNSATANGVTLTANGDGTYTINGTATSAVRFDLYGSTSDIPAWLERGKEYYCVAYGRDKAEIAISSYNDSLVRIVNNFDVLTLFTCPASGGFFLSVVISSGVEYSETIRIVILSKTSITDGVYNANNALPAVTDEIANLKSVISESNLPINYAVISTAKKTHNGLTFSAVDGTVTVDGTSTGVAFYDLFRLLTNPKEFPLKAGHTYVLRFADETLSPLIYKQVEYKVSSSSGNTSLYSKNKLSDYVVFTVPDTLYDFYVRLVCESSGVTYANKKISFTIEEITDKKDVIVVDVNGGGDFTSLKAGIEYAMLNYGTRVIVKRGTYNLVTEFGKSYLDSLSGNDFGIMLGNGIEIMFAPNAYVTFDYDGTNEWIIQNFSPFNTANDLGYTIDGLHCTAHNCRYILHDDPRPGVKNRYSKNVIRNCYFELFPSPQYPNWVNHQIIGGGLGDSTVVEIENCIFNDHFSGASSYSSVSYHNSTSGNAQYESRIVVKDCYFMDGNNLTFEGYGASTLKTKVIATNNNLENGEASIIYNNTAADNMTLYKWNNHART
jgi:hypothetical protein